MEFRIVGIPLEEFITVLENLYNNGADYADIVGNTDDDKGLMKIEIKKEYMCPPEEMEEDEDMTDDEVIDFYNNLI
jgi:hypothetical protein